MKLKSLNLRIWQPAILNSACNYDSTRQSNLIMGEHSFRLGSVYIEDSVCASPHISTLFHTHRLARGKH